MDMDGLRDRGLVIVGCGRMGSALLRGWLADGFPPGAVHVVDPAPGDWLGDVDVNLNGRLPDAPGLLLIAVKPQAMAAALPDAARFGGGATVVLSVAAGTPIATFEAAFGAGTPVVRAMPNTPAAIGCGITAIVGNAAVADAMPLAEALMGAVGQVVRLEDEALMDAVTGVSGSGPAYVFHMIEALAAAGAAEGLPPDLALTLARATVSGAARLAEAGADPAQLRRDVTSPQGTTAAALEVLMDDATGLPPLMRRAVAAAAARSRALST